MTLTCHYLRGHPAGSLLLTAGVVGLCPVRFVQEAYGDKAPIPGFYHPATDPQLRNPLKREEKDPRAEASTERPKVRTHRMIGFFHLEGVISGLPAG